MIRYIAKRLLYAALTIFLLLTLTFFMMRWLPGDPFIGDKAIAESVKEAMYAKYGLDKPVFEQYIIYVSNFLRLDFGDSLKYNRPVTTIIAQTFPVSAELGVRALVLSITFGLLLGVFAAIKRGTLADTLSMTIAIIGVSIPSFIMGALMQYFLSVKFREAFGYSILPVTGWAASKNFSHFRMTIMPSIALSFSSMATIARLMRTSMLDVLGQDYIMTAKAKGLSTPKIVWRHGIRNAILPVVTILGPTIASVLTGSFIVEKIFNIPGMGKFFVNAIQEQDYTLISGTTVFYGAFLVVAILLVDILYGFVDPRIKLSGSVKVKKKKNETLNKGGSENNGK